MKTFDGAYTTHIATRETSLAYALKVTREDGTIFGFTSHDVDSTVSSQLYSAEPGLDVSSVVSAANASVDNLELTTLHDGTVFTTVDVFNGVWRNAAFQLFRYNWASPTDGIDKQVYGTFGEVELRQGLVSIELRGLKQYLQQPVGSASSKTCRARLGSTDKNNGGLCMKNLTTFTYTGMLTHVTSNQVFRDSARAEALAWFDEGEITFTSGANNGITAKIKAHAANGTFTLALPLYGTVAIGNTYSVIAGCRKRLSEDCYTKFNNVLNFQGEPHRQGINDLIKPASSSV